MNRIVYSLFNKQPGKFRKRQQIRHRKRIEKAAIDKMVDTWLTTYKNLDFSLPPKIVTIIKISRRKIS